MIKYANYNETDTHPSLLREQPRVTLVTQLGAPTRTLAKFLREREVSSNR